MLANAAFAQQAVGQATAGKLGEVVLRVQLADQVGDIDGAFEAARALCGSLGHLGCGNIKARATARLDMARRYQAIVGFDDSEAAYLLPARQRPYRWQALPRP